MLGRLTRFLSVCVLCGTLVPLAAAQETQKVTLDVSETIFSVVTAANVCGYDQELASSDPLRLKIRAEVMRNVENSADARDAEQVLCAFYHDHQQADDARTLAQYISLALNLGEPPAFVPKVKEADLPPDAAYVLGFVPLLQRFYTSSDLHSIWLRHSQEYQSLIDQNSAAVSKLLLTTDVYLKMPISGYLGRRFVVYIEPMAAPGQVNARNYGTDYFIVLSPENGKLKLDPIRHTYLHFILDPMALKRGNALKRLEPLLDSIKTAPLDESFKSDVSLLVTESIIRAIEARSIPGKGKEADQKREEAAKQAAEEGYILTPYFYGQLVDFEKTPVGLQDAYGDWLYYLDVNGEKKRANNIQWKVQATPEVVRTSPRRRSVLELAEERYVRGDYAKARELAQQVLDSKQGDAGRALFLLARIATMSGDMNGARTYFEKTLQTSHEPRVVAWSHIYLGRIDDLQDNREKAVEHYRAALNAGDSSAPTKAAAERGLEHPYAPPVASQDRKPK